MQQERAAVICPAYIDRVRSIGMTLVVLIFSLCSCLPAMAASGQLIAHNTPPYVANATNLGREDAAKTIEVSIWLKPHNRAQMDALARDLYNRNSPNYRHWLTRSQIAKQFAPTADEAITVKKFFESHNLAVVQVGANNFFVRARGTVEDVEKAFHVQLNNYRVNNKIVRANASDPYVEGAAASLVRAVAGLDSGEYEHPAMPQPASLAALKSVNAKLAAQSSAAFYSPNCFDGVVTQKFSTNGDGELPIGTYKGNHINLQSITSPGCAYTPGPIQTAYKLSGLYAEGYTGTGQTIVILDWCGSTTIKNDANVFSKKFGLPLLTSNNFQIIYTPTRSQCESADQTEINIDVEWAHAIAPGANIDLVVPPSATFQDVDQAEFYAVNHALGNSFSGSYGSPEAVTPASVLDTENLISEIAAISGISTSFSSGDQGDYTAFGLPPTVNAPADSPWATAVGGVSLALKSDHSIAWQTGWGNNQTLLTQTGAIYDPPTLFGFSGGAGGGQSNCAVQDSSGNCLAGFPKPVFQKGLSGKYRQLPDIAWVADPFTGVVIAISVPGQIPQLAWQVWGGTSVACPMFAGLWAIANQEAGQPLGQAAQYVYSLPVGAVTDVVPITTSTNVTASIQEPNATNKYSPSEVMGGYPSGAPGKFVSAIWDYALEADTALALSFGTDCSTLPASGNNGTSCNSPSALHTKIGWDNVTGVGTPNAQAFADSFKPVSSAIN